MKRIDKAVKRRISNKILLRRSLNLAKRINGISELEREKQIHDKWENMPKISIITPLYNTPDKYLRELLDSVQNQTYSNWEICFADGSDEVYSYVEKICREVQKKDKRIKYVKLRGNKGISENTNQCLQLATGEYIGLLDHDDVLHEAALYEMAKEISRTSADFLYSDEVKFKDSTQNAIDYNFKSDFSKDELRSHNYICHFTVFKKELLNRAGGMFLKEYDGSQDHDLFLRLTECADKVIHVPKVLYFWRVHEQSVSMNLDSKAYAVDAAIKAISAQLERCHEQGTVASNLPYRTIYKINYTLQPVPVSIIFWGKIADKNKILKKIQKIIDKTTYSEYEILVPVLEKSACEETELSGKTIRFIYVKKETTGNLWNVMAKEAKGEVLLYLSVESFPLNDRWIQEMLMFVQRRDVCITGAKLYDKKGKVYSGGIALENTDNYLKHMFMGTENNEQGYEAMLKLVRNVTALSRECIMMKKRTWEELNGFTGEMEGYESIDFCLRGKEKGLLNVWTCFAEIEVKRELKVTANKKFKERWFQEIEGDMCAHPYLKELKLI